MAFTIDRSRRYPFGASVTYIDNFDSLSLHELPVRSNTFLVGKVILSCTILLFYCYSLQATHANSGSRNCLYILLLLDIKI